MNNCQQHREMKCTWESVEVQQDPDSVLSSPCDSFQEVSDLISYLLRCQGSGDRGILKLALC